MSLNVDEKIKIFQQFGKNETDTGSSAVQIALLTERIKQLTGHLQENAHDFSSKRGLLKLVARRRILLRYLEQHDNIGYKNTITSLNLKK